MMQLRSPSSFCPSETQAFFLCIFLAILAHFNEMCRTSTTPHRARLPVAICDCRQRCRTKNENRVSYYIWPAQIRRSTVILIQALGVIHDELYEYSPSRREMHGRRRCDSSNERPGLITFIESKQSRDLPRLLNPANCDGHVLANCPLLYFYL